MLKSLLCLFFFCLFSISSQAKEEAPIWVGVEITDYSPYYFLDEEQRYQGAARDILDLFSVTTSKALEYYPMPVPRLFHEFVEGRVDLKFPDNPLWSASLKTDIKVFYSEPLFKVKESVLVLKQDSGETPAQDISYVGTILGFSTPGIATHIKNNEFDVVQANKIEQLIHMLASKRVQALYFNESVALELAKKMYPLQKLVRHSHYPAFNYAYHISSIKHPELIEAFNKFLMSHTEQVSEIRHRYGLE